MFFMVGIIYDRVHHRNLEEFGGLFGKMPVYTAMAMGLFFAALGLPGLCGFPGEVWVVLSVWKYSILLAVVSASVVVLTVATSCGPCNASTWAPSIKARTASISTPPMPAKT